MKTKIIARLFLFAALFTFCQRVWSQPKIQWDTAFGGGNIYNYGIGQITNDDGIVYRGCKDTSHIWKLDAAGHIQWDKNYGAECKGEANSIKQTPDSGYILTGSVRISGLNSNLWVLKLNSNGDSVWSRKYASAYTAKGNDIVANSDGSYFIVGQIENPDYFNNNLMVLKINAKGDTLWTKKYKNSLSYSCKSLIKCSQGGYAAIAIIDSTYEAGLYYQTIRFGENGDTLWTKTSDCLINSISQTSDNGFVVTGTQYKNGLDWDLLLLKINSKGEKEWSKTFGGNSWEMGNDAKQTNDGGYIIAGTTSSFGSGDNLDAWLIKTDENGNKIWSDTIGGPENNERAFQVFVTSDNGYYVTGNVKHLFWVARFETDNLKMATTSNQALTITVAGTIRNFPNPFSSATCFEYLVPNNSKVVISIYGLSGNEVFRLSNQFVASGQYRTTWDGTDVHGNKVAAGMYYYQLIIEDNQNKPVSKIYNKLIRL